MTPSSQRPVEYRAARSDAGAASPRAERARRDWPFFVALWVIGGFYVLLIFAMLLADTQFTTPGHLLQALKSEEIRFSTKLSLITCSVTTILSLWVAVPLGYLMSRWDDRPIRAALDRFARPVVGNVRLFRPVVGLLNPKAFLDAVLDIPIVLPPLVVGLSLLILMQTRVGRFIERMTSERMGWMLTYLLIPAVTLLASLLLLRSDAVRSKAGSRWEGFAWIGSLAAPTAVVLLLAMTPAGPRVVSVLQRSLGTSITYAVPSIVLAQFAVACAFAVRTMRVTFDQITPRGEQVAMTLGCSRSQAFWLVALPEAWRGLLTAATLAWARSLGEFGPILIFSGATRLRTEVLPTTVFLELSIGNIEAAVAVSLLMVIVAVIVLILMRLAAGERSVGEGVR